MNFEYKNSISLLTVKLLLRARNLLINLTNNPPHKCNKSLDVAGTNIECYGLFPVQGLLLPSHYYICRADIFIESFIFNYSDP